MFTKVHHDSKIHFLGSSSFIKRKNLAITYLYHHIHHYVKDEKPRVMLSETAGKGEVPWRMRHGRGGTDTVLSTPGWGSVNSALTNNPRDVKGPHTFLFGRVPGL